MTAPAWFNNKVKLNEGDVSLFQYIKLVRLSDHEEYMILEDNTGVRHLVPYKYYLNYGFEPGMELTCKVDRINCTGRVFLEPAHPIYTEGASYEFRIISVEDHIQMNSDKITVTIADVFNNSIRCEMHPGTSDFIADEKIILKVKGFKKGKPVLIAE